MSKRLRVAIVGCGAVAQNYHIPAIRKSKYGTVEAVVDEDPVILREIKRKLKISHTFTHHRQLQGVADAVIIATPNATHFSIVSECLDLSMHVLCEKPLALDHEEVTLLYEKARQKDLLISVGFQRRFNANIRILRALIEELGMPIHAELSLGSDVTRWPARTAYRFDRSLAGGGCLLDSGTHLIDLAVWMFGTNARVSSAILYDSSRYGVEYGAYVRLWFGEAPTVDIFCSYRYGLSNEIRVKWKNGWAATPLNSCSLPVVWHHRKSLLSRSFGVQQLLPKTRDPYENQVSEFLRGVLHREGETVTQDQATLVHRIVNDTYQMARTHESD